LPRSSFVPDRLSSASARLLISSAKSLSRCVVRCWAHTVHEFAEGRARFTGQGVAGLAKVVEVEPGQARRIGFLPPAGEVAPL
jgi:hypothetical protein